MPWVHIDDLIRAYQQAITNERMQGAYNVIGGNDTNADLLHALAKVLGKPFFVPNVPAFVLKVMLGELAVLLLEGSQASNERILQSGFTIEHTVLHEALKDLLRER